jgi:RNA polymerase sigma factor (sigma-70 family)
LPVRSTAAFRLVWHECRIGAGREDRVDSAQQLADLIERASGGDQEAWRALVERFASMVWAVARSYRLDHADAADVCQTAWLRLAENLGSLRDPARLPGWLATTARRESLRVLAGRRREAPGDVPDGPDADHTSVPEAFVLTEDRDSRLWQAFSELPERCQQLLRVLATAPDLSYVEVGSALGIPVGSIGPTRGRCLQALRRRLHPDDFTGNEFSGPGAGRFVR